MGNVLPAGQGQAPARQAARGARLPDATGATTVNKVCGSGMKATMLAHDIIKAGSAEIVLSGGMESMSNAPYLLQKARGGYRAGHDRIIDHMMMDGLEDAYETGRSMGDFGEATAEAIPGAELVVYDEMGHDIPEPLWDNYVADLVALSERAA